jgi:hypothetical protein
VFVAALDIVVLHLRKEVRERFRCCRLLSNEGHEFVLLFLSPPHQFGHLIECALKHAGSRLETDPPLLRPTHAGGSGRSIRLLFALRQAGFAQSFDDSLMNALKVGSSLQWMPAQV